jgi:hypothetical protein
MKPASGATQALRGSALRAEHLRVTVGKGHFGNQNFTGTNLSV